MYSFETFTSDAKRALTLAQEEAERSRHTYIGTEHLLLGLMRVESGTANTALKDLGVSIDPVRDLIDSRLERNQRMLVQSIIPTSRVKKVIELSFHEANRMGQREVDTAHILIGLMIEGDGIAAHALEDLGATTERVVAAAERALGGAPSGRGRERAHGQPPVLLPSPSDEIAHLLAVMSRPRIARLLRAKGLDIEALERMLLTQLHATSELRSELSSTEVELRAAIAAQNFELAAELRDRLASLVGKVEKGESDWLDTLT